MAGDFSFIVFFFFLQANGLLILPFESIYIFFFFLFSCFDTNIDVRRYFYFKNEIDSTLLEK